MKFRLLLIASMFLVSPRLVHAEEATIPPAIFRYVAQEEPAYRWSLVREVSSLAGKTYQLELVSQEWQGQPWTHSLLVFDPPEVEHSQQMLLFINGGRNGQEPRERDFAIGQGLAMMCKARVALLNQVPNQPLMGDRVEDDLITESWLKFLETGDESWPLLFPMVKSATKAMDALSEFAREQWEADVQEFVITGASKRGWVSWLTPVVDKRILATAPIVIDFLNFPLQMQNQIKVWGAYSEQIADYTHKGLIRSNSEPLSPREELLWRMMDPYTYRSRLTLPKLMIVGTNDPYWVVDSMNLYWDELSGPRYILQVPNAGHSLKGGQGGALATLAVFFRHIASKQELPQFTWETENHAQGLTLKVKSDCPPTQVRFWQTTSPNRDFRPSVWTSQVPTDLRTTSEDSPCWTAQLPAPATGHAAIFAEAQYSAFEIEYSLSTLVFVK